MISRLTGAALVAAALGLAGAAQASDLYALNPSNSSFTATGTGSVTGTQGAYSCTVTMTGTTKKTVGEITGVTFSGPPGCESVIAGNLPWKVRPISFNGVRITHFTLSYPGLGRCGPNQIKGSLSEGILSIQDNVTSSTGVCNVSATLTTSPSLSITAASSAP